MSETPLEKAERQFEQAKARLDAARAREREKVRKQDARRKIILGGALIERAERDPVVAKLVADLVRGFSRKQDQKTFAGWSLPSPALRSAGSEIAGSAAPPSGPSKEPAPHQATMGRSLFDDQDDPS